MWAFCQSVEPQFHPQECVPAVPAHYPCTFRLDWQRRLSRLLFRNEHYGAKVDYASTVGSRTSYSPRCVLTNEETITRASNIFLPCRGGFDWRSFITNCALNHMLVKFSIQVDERLAHATVDDGNTACSWTGDGCIRRWEFSSWAAFLQVRRGCGSDISRMGC